MKTIFVIDDDPVILTVARETLKNGGHKVFALPSAEVLFALLSKTIPDLIILDIEMPEMNGFECHEKLKAYEQYADIPVAFLTGTLDAKIEMQCLERGAVDYIIKPFSPQELLTRVEKHLKDKS